jgi:hypothetical protein
LQLTPVVVCLNLIQAGKWGSKSYASAYNAGYAAGVLREQKKELHAQQMMQVIVFVSELKIGPLFKIPF